MSKWWTSSFNQNSLVWNSKLKKFFRGHQRSRLRKFLEGHKKSSHFSKYRKNFGLINLKYTNKPFFPIFFFLSALRNSDCLTSLSIVKMIFFSLIRQKQAVYIIKMHCNCSCEIRFDTKKNSCPFDLAESCAGSFSTHYYLTT